MDLDTHRCNAPFQIVATDTQDSYSYPRFESPGQERLTSPRTELHSWTVSGLIHKLSFRIHVEVRQIIAYSQPS